MIGRNCSGEGNLGIEALITQRDKFRADVTQILFRRCYAENSV